eukprot:m.52321 g.52321  ORF g.52321 m.52321 type:complete len:168 (+) comp13060_c0_seq1:105-608(+)
MTGPSRRKRMHKNILDTKKRFRTRKRTKDHDQIVNDLKAENVMKLIHHPVDGDLPGLGQFYCIHCSRHFVNSLSLDEHIKSKIHRRRMKELRNEPYSQAEAEAAAGMGQYIARKPIAVPKMTDLLALRAGQSKAMESDGAAAAAAGAAAAGGAGAAAGGMDADDQGL